MKRNKTGLKFETTRKRLEEKWEDTKITSAMESLRIDHRLNKPHEKRKRQEIRNQWELKKRY